MNKKMDFAGCGALNLDIIYELQVADFSKVLGLELQPGHEVVLPNERLFPILQRLSKHGRMLAKSGGGSAANTICILSALGHETLFLGVAGANEAGDEVLASMKGVNTALVQRLGENQVCLVLLSPGSRDRGLCVFSACNALSSLPETWPNALVNVRSLHLSSFSDVSQIWLQEALVQGLTSQQLLSLDPGEIYASLGIEGLLRLLRRTNLLFITGHEVSLLTGKPVEEGVKRLLAMLFAHRPDFHIFEEAEGAVIVVKQGKHGATAFGANGLVLHVHACEVAQVVDTTGAGDAFNAGFLHAMMQGKSLEVCMKQGHQVAALSLSDFGRNWLNVLTASNGVFQHVKEIGPLV